MDHMVLGCLSGETDINTSVNESICRVPLGADMVDLCLGEG